MPPKKTGQDAALGQLKDDLANGTLGQLYLLHGEEVYLRDHYLERMKQALVGQLDAFSYHRLSGQGLTVQALSGAIDAFPMGSERTMVLVYDFDLYKGDGKEELLAVLSDLPDHCCLVFVYDVIPFKQDARKKIHGLIKEKGQTVSFSRPGQSELLRWIRRRFQALDRDIRQQEAEYLIFLCGGLMTGLIGEIEKIGAYSKGPEISKEDIDAVAEPVLDAKVFQMTDAVLSEQIEQAASVLGELLRMQESPIMLLSVLGKQMRQLYTARLAIEQGKDTAFLMALWGMRSAYPAQKLMQGARRFDAPWCRRAVRLCAETDWEIKRSIVPPDGGLMLLLMQLTK